MASLVASEPFLLQYPKASGRISSSRNLSPRPCMMFFSRRRIDNKSAVPVIRVSVSSSLSAIPTEISRNSSLRNRYLITLVSDSTRTISGVFALAFCLFKPLADTIRKTSESLKGFSMNPSEEEMEAIMSLKNIVLCAAGPLFFAAMRDRPSGYLNTPLTVVAAGMSKWLDIYSGVLMVRVLLSWFPNIPWERQPLNAIRDLCDPYLNLFRNIIPPIFDTLDVSPLLAFGVLGTLGSILHNTRGSF